MYWFLFLFFINKCYLFDLFVEWIEEEEVRRIASNLWKKDRTKQRMKNWTKVSRKKKPNEKNGHSSENQWQLNAQTRPNKKKKIGHSRNRAVKMCNELKMGEKNFCCFQQSMHFKYEIWKWTIEEELLLIHCMCMQTKLIIWMQSKAFFSSWLQDIAMK